MEGDVPQPLVSVGPILDLGAIGVEDTAINLVKVDGAIGATLDAFCSSTGEIANGRAARWYQLLWL